ncbi:hypothetical protein Dimus_023037 [Dionaea muscipula]
MGANNYTFKPKEFAEYEVKRDRARIDLAKDDIDEFSVKLPGNHLHVQQIVYEKKPKFCRRCWSVGHLAEVCHAPQGHFKWVPKVRVDPSASDFDTKAATREECHQAPEKGISLSPRATDSNHEPMRQDTTAMSSGNLVDHVAMSTQDLRVNIAGPSAELINDPPHQDGSLGHNTQLKDQDSVPSLLRGPLLDSDGFQLVQRKHKHDRGAQEFITFYQKLLGTSDHPPDGPWGIISQGHRVNHHLPSLRPPTDSTIEADDRQ